MMNKIKIICLYGPESTGKSTLARRLAEIYKTKFVPEVAKEIITSNNFSMGDIIRIGYEQIKRVKEKIQTANKVLFCDTDLITTQIYSRRYLGVVPPILYKLEREISYDQYLLFDIDVPWVSDGLRDLKNERIEMLHIFQSELDKRKISYEWIQDTYEEREKKIIKIIDSILML